jgi:twitching motility protein PilT
VKELIEDKDRTKELHDAIAQGVTSYGMQTFDQSLMSLLTNHLITYEEALRQATNADDFALRVSGIGGTSDSSWDQFDNSTGGQRPGMRPEQAQGANQARPPTGPQQPMPAQMGQPMPAQMGQPPRPASQPFPASQPPRAPTQPPAQPAQPGQQQAGTGNPNDDFQIERF